MYFHILLFAPKLILSTFSLDEVNLLYISPKAWVIHLNPSTLFFTVSCFSQFNLACKLAFHAASKLIAGKKKLKDENKACPWPLGNRNIGLRNGLATAWCISRSTFLFYLLMVILKGLIIMLSFKHQPWSSSQ